LTKFDDIKSVEMNWKSFSSADGITLDLRITPEPRESGGHIVSFIAMDPPEHRDQRRAVTPAVQPANLHNLEPLIRERTVDVLESLPADVVRLGQS
jgi:cytochrome P450